MFNEATIVFALFVGVLLGAIAWLAATRYGSKGLAEAVQLDRAKERSGSRRGAIAKNVIAAADSVNRMLPIAKSEAEEHRSRLARAGIAMDPGTWHGITLLAIVLAAAIGVIVAIASNGFPGWQRVGFIAIFVCVGYALPRLFLHTKAKSRRKKIESSFASTVEMLSTAISAGYTIEKGFRLVSQKCDGPLAAEFGRVDAEINFAGVSKVDALRNMAARCQSQRVSMFASAVIQAMQQGSGLARILEIQAKIARDTYFDDLKARANKIPLKVLFPLAGIFIPCMLILALTPVLFSVLETLGGFF